ncbi:hypothetical protein EN751_38710 [Mesorhizobium sp. M4A.F.Ca.ET.029.04.2.1]|nr:hypothetical protein EN751_38710 [Mesorhizobium sp. M4A.F.Ca.ET.029.04.2.1]
MGACAWAVGGFGSSSIDGRGSAGCVGAGFWSDATSAGFSTGAGVGAAGFSAGGWPASVCGFRDEPAAGSSGGVVAALSAGAGFGVFEGESVVLPAGGAAGVRRPLR